MKKNLGLDTGNGIDLYRNGLSKCVSVFAIDLTSDFTIDTKDNCRKVYLIYNAINKYKSILLYFRTAIMILFCYLP